MDLNEEIAKVAYELFERDGRRDGKDKEHWSEAEEIVRARHAADEKKAETRKGDTGLNTTKENNRKNPERQAERGRAEKRAAVRRRPG